MGKSKMVSVFVERAKRCQLLEVSLVTNMQISTYEMVRTQLSNFRREILNPTKIVLIVIDQVKTISSDIRTELKGLLTNFFVRVMLISKNRLKLTDIGKQYKEIKMWGLDMVQSQQLILYNFDEMLVESHVNQLFLNKLIKEADNKPDQVGELKNEEIWRYLE